MGRDLKISAISVAQVKEMGTEDGVGDGRAFHLVSMEGRTHSLPSC